MQNEGYDENKRQAESRDHKASQSEFQKFGKGQVSLFHYDGNST